jgi:predicted nucleic acid-binding protein
VIVVDTHVITAILLGGDVAGLAERVAEKDPDWAAPLLWRSEFRNVLAGQMRRGWMGPDQAIRIASAAEARMVGREFMPRADDVLDLVSRSPCTAYDCEFVAVAKGMGIPLVTEDRQVLAAFPGIAVSQRAFVGH